MRGFDSIYIYAVEPWGFPMKKKQQQHFDMHKTVNKTIDTTHDYYYLT